MAKKTQLNSSNSSNEKNLSGEELKELYESKKLSHSFRTEENLRQLLLFALSIEDMDYEIIEFCSNELDKIIQRDSNEMKQVYDNIMKKIDTYIYKKTN